MVYRVLDQRRLFWHTKEKFRNTKRSWVFLIFYEGVKITSVGLKLDRPQLQHWLLFLEHNTINRLRSKDLMLLQASLWSMTVFMIQFETLPVLLILSNAGSSASFCRIWIIQAPALVDLRRRSFIMIKFSRAVCTTYTSIQATHKTSSSTCNVLLLSFLVRSNRTTLQTWVYRVFNRANWLDILSHYVLI